MAKEFLKKEKRVCLKLDDAKSYSLTEACGLVKEITTDEI